MLPGETTKRGEKQEEREKPRQGVNSKALGSSGCSSGGRGWAPVLPPQLAIDEGLAQGASPAAFRQSSSSRHGLLVEELVPCITVSRKNRSKPEQGIEM